jgi:hypothetical protein
VPVDNQLRALVVPYVTDMSLEAYKRRLAAQKQDAAAVAAAAAAAGGGLPYPHHQDQQLDAEFAPAPPAQQQQQSRKPPPFTPLSIDGRNLHLEDEARCNAEAAGLRLRGADLVSATAPNAGDGMGMGMLLAARRVQNNGAFQVVVDDVGDGRDGRQRSEGLFKGLAIRGMDVTIRLPPPGSERSGAGGGGSGGVGTVLADTSQHYIVVPMVRRF